MIDLPARERSAQHAFEQMPEWQQSVVSDTEASLERRLVLADYKCIEWDAEKMTIIIASDPLLAEMKTRADERLKRRPHG
jgi:hypothetical protein